MFLSEADLVKYYPQVSEVSDEDKALYLSRANTYCYGYIGGRPPKIDDQLKIAVAYCFEIFARGETAQVDEDTGDITDIAPAATVRKSNRIKEDIFDTLHEMLRPYRLAYENQANITDRSVKFL